MKANDYLWQYAKTEGGKLYDAPKLSMVYTNAGAAAHKLIATIGIDKVHSLRATDPTTGSLIFRWDEINGVTTDTTLSVPSKSMEGLKYDEGKPDYTLIPWEALEEVVKVLEAGEKKYARNNWQKVEDADFRYLKAAFRHLISYAKGEQNDPETGLSHLAHACCCMLFLLHFDKG